MDLNLEFQAEVWASSGKGAWFFVTLPVELADQVKFFQGQYTGFGMVNVKAQIGTASWKTSIFPDKKSGSFLLPLKAAVRKSAKITSGSVVDVSLRIIA